MARDAETEAERRARKERDAHRQRKHQERAKGKAKEEKPSEKTKGGLPPLGEGENRLLRDTPFLAEFTFRNDLPLPPIGPKFLPIVVDRARLAAYQPFGLLWDKPQDAPLERDLGISLDPLDCERYRVPPGPPPPMHPDDEALLAVDPTGAGPGYRQPKKGAKEEQKAGWLMRTLYLSDMQLPKTNADENAHARALKERQLALEGVVLPVPEGSDARTEQVLAIEATFAAMQAPPVHARNPSLRPVEVLPLLPDFERCSESYMHVQFDQDPMREVPFLAGAPAALRDAVARSAFIKSYTVAVDEEGAPPEKLLAFFAPCEAAARANDGGAGGAVAYQWVREYNYRTHDAEAQPALAVLMGDGAASYVTLEKRIELKRRVARSGGLDSALPRPQAVTLTTRKRTADEEATAEVAKRMITHPQYDRPATPVEDMEEEEEDVQPAVRGSAAAAIQAAIFGDDSD